MLKYVHKYNSIQALRALAVTLVVYAHSLDSAVKNFGGSQQSSFFYLENWGAMGLDLFFVISGFIMTRIIHKYEFVGGWKLFAFKRALRILPQYWGMSLLAALLILRTYPIKPATIWKTITILPIFESTFVFPILEVGWSLGYEIYFYLIIVLILALRLKHPKAVLLAVLVFLSILGFYTNSSQSLFRFLSSPLLIEFALGVGSGMLYDRFNPENQWHRLGMFVSFSFGLLFMIFPVFLGFNHISEVDYVVANNPLALSRSLHWGFPCALFLTGCVLLERTYSVSVPHLLIHIGDASYSNYLLHGLVIIFAYKSILKLQLSADGYVIFLIILCTGLSSILYRFGEKPLNSWLSAYFFSKGHKSTKERPIVL